MTHAIAQDKTLTRIRALLVEHPEGLSVVQMRQCWGDRPPPIEVIQRRLHWLIAQGNEVARVDQGGSRAAVYIANKFIGG